jgi:Fur family ferric uptake transcriptional regulator
MNELKDIAKTQRRSGLKATLPRLRILQLFHECGTRHLSAEEIYRFLINEKIDIGLATVYRVLMQFAETGIVIRRHFESGAAVFELNEGSHHDHLICTGCGKVEEFVDKDIERRQEEIAKERGFALHDHSLSLYGVCRACKSTTTTSGKSGYRGDTHEQQENRHHPSAAC